MVTMMFIKLAMHIHLDDDDDDDRDAGEHYRDWWLVDFPATS